MIILSISPLMVGYAKLPAVDLSDFEVGNLEVGLLGLVLVRMVCRSHSVDTKVRWKIDSNFDRVVSCSICILNAKIFFDTM